MLYWDKSIQDYDSPRTHGHKIVHDLQSVTHTLIRFSLPLVSSLYAYAYTFYTL